MASDPTPEPNSPAPSIEDLVRLVVAQVAARGWWETYIVPGAAITGAAGTFICVCWLTLLSLGSAPAPVPPTPPAPEADIMLPTTLKGPVGRAIPLEAQTKATEVRWWCADTGDLVVGHGKKAAFVAPKPGTYTVLCWTALKGHPTDAAVCTITVGEPVPPVPPTPPVPPSPPAPIPGEGLRVLIVYDKSALAKYKPGQTEVLMGTKVRAWLNEHCVKGSDGKTPEYRIFQSDANVEKETKVWQDAMKLPRPSLPWLFVANGDKGVNCALPETSDETMKLLESVVAK